MRRCRTVFFTAVVMIAVATTPTSAFLKSWSRQQQPQPPRGFGDGGSAVIDEDELRSVGAEASDFEGFGGVLSVPDKVAAEGAGLLQEFEGREATFGACWKDAVAKLRDACSIALVDDDVRSRLGLAFTSCQMRNDGKGHLAPPCDEHSSVQACLRAFDESTAYHFYVQYKMHVDALCFHIQQELFRERSNEAVARLHAATRAAGSHLARLDKRTTEWDTAVADIKRRQDEAAVAAHAVANALVNLRNIEQTLQMTLKDKVAPLQQLGERLDGVLEKQQKLEREHREAAKRAEQHASRSTEALERLATGTKLLETGITEAKSATSALSDEHRAAHKGLDEVKAALAEVQKLQSHSIDRAAAVAKHVENLSEAAEGRLVAQAKLLAQLEGHTKALVQESVSHQSAISDSAASLLGGIAEIQAFQEQFSAAVISVEAGAVYIVASMATMLLTMPPQTRDARFPALVLGPLSCFVVERFYAFEAAEVLSRAGLGPSPAEVAALHGERSPSSTAAASLRGGGSHAAATAVVRTHYVPLIRQLFAALTAALLVFAMARYESAETMQRRVVAEAVAQALRDPVLLRDLAAAAAATAGAGAATKAADPAGNPPLVVMPPLGSATPASTQATDALARGSSDQRDDNDDASSSSSSSAAASPSPAPAPRRGASKRASAGARKSRVSKKASAAAAAKGADAAGGDTDAMDIDE